MSCYVYKEVSTLGARHFQCFLYFLILFIGYGFRVNLSVAIVAMTDPTASPNPNIPTYPEWVNHGAILSAFFWGYGLPQVFAGYAANRFSAKWLLVGTMGFQSCVGFCTPFFAAYYGEKGVMAVRAIQGLFQGFLFPCITHLLSNWVPPEERARLANFSFGGIPLGSVAGILVTGLISATWYGWLMVFYVYGILGILSCLLFAFMGYNSPAEHPTICIEEKNYIEKSLSHLDEKSSHRVPWAAIFTSKPLLALLVVQCGSVFGFWILLTQIPTYMSNVMHFNIKNNSLLSALPYFVTYILGILFGFISDYIINSGYLTRTASRKVFQSVASAVPALALIVMGYVKSDEPSKAVWLLVVTVGLYAATGCGSSLNHMDLSPKHSGILIGLCNGLSNVMAIIAPLVVQFLIKDPTDPVQWKIIFFLAAGVQVVTCLVYVLFGSAEVQPWNADAASEEYEMKTNANKI